MSGPGVGALLSAGSPVPESIALVQQPSPTPTPTEPGGRGEDFGKSSPVGLLLLILFFIAVALLVRSMTKHLRRVPASFEEPTEETGKEGGPKEDTGDGPDQPSKG
ncbi:hypothetical protein GCM10012275_44070 [Longimycelium tulufanense]|uniref:Uncharacterized protein n=1 Tax=Longimycelium tulufanense TaxID=907463 RepID=A0A8J3FW40_9PSEU|nr:hypothetical protein [Longimycelium tulufanense]GGM68807.1 hypothetical protein GCM10012275_44070 [Longimycelium tulufanense]